MMLIGKTANCAVLKAVEITRSVKAALKCVIAVVFVDVDLP